MSRFSLITILVLLLPGPARGELVRADRDWMENVLTLWRTVSAEDLGLGDRPVPWVVFFGPQWVWHVNPDLARVPAAPDEDATWRGSLAVTSADLPVVGFRHEGTILLPDGDQIPPELILFASTYGETKSPYFVMAMPEIWRATPRHANDANLDALIAGVFVHEITHTQQAGTLGARIDSLVAAHGLDDDEVDDDMIQRLFGERPGYREAYEHERDLLFAAARSGSRCGELAGEAMKAIEARRARWFQDEDAVYGELEDIFLNFEGVANWAAYRALIAAGVPAEQALPQLRRGGRSWSQDEGLALFLVLDRLQAPWRERVFSDDPGSILEMLASATQ